MTRVLFWVAVLAWAVVIWTSPGCMSHITDELDAKQREDNQQWNAIIEIHDRLDALETGRNSPAEGYGHYPGDGR